MTRTHNLHFAIKETGFFRANSKFSSSTEVVICLLRLRLYPFTRQCPHMTKHDYGFLQQAPVLLPAWGFSPREHVSLSMGRRKVLGGEHLQTSSHPMTQEIRLLASFLASDRTALQCALHHLPEAGNLPTDIPVLPLHSLPAFPENLPPPALKSLSLCVLLGKPTQVPQWWWKEKSDPVWSVFFKDKHIGSSHRA